MGTIQLARKSWWSVTVLSLAVFVYLYTAVVSLPLPEGEPFPGDFLTPYSEGRHGSRRTTRDIKECQHVTWENRTYEEFKLDPAHPGSTGLQYDLHKFADTIQRDYFRHKYVIGTIAFINNPYYTFSVLEPREKGGCKMNYFSATRSFVRETVRLRSHGCKLAANGGYFSMRNGQCLGNVVSDGRIVQTANDEQNANFGIREDGTIVVGYIPDEEIVNSTNPFRQLVTGVIWLVRNGTNYVNESMQLECASHEDTGNMETFASVVSARTALGHDDQGRLVMAQVEGQTHRRGINLRDFADLLIRHGVVNAINLDGGGSSTLVHEDVLINYPSDHCFGSPEYRCERSVSTALCVHDVECLEPDCNGHGSCDLGQCSCDHLWVGEACDKLNCSLTDCSGHGNCSEGVCSCDAGWTGELCNKTCPSNRYGPNCKSYCYCYGSSLCDHLTGECVCPPGRHGFACWQECSNNTFGLKCANRCDYPNCSGHGKCSPVNGSCLCEDGWSGVSCNETLASGSGASGEGLLLYPNETSESPYPTKTLTSTTLYPSLASEQDTPASSHSSTSQIMSNKQSSSQKPQSNMSSNSTTTSTNNSTQKPLSDTSSDSTTNSTTCLTGPTTSNNSDTSCTSHHTTRNTFILGVVLALFTLCGHFVLCLCSRRYNKQSSKPWTVSNGDYSKMRRTRPVKRRRLRRKRKSAFVPVPQSSTDCSI